MCQFKNEDLLTEYEAMLKSLVLNFGTIPIYVIKTLLLFIKDKDFVFFEKLWE